MPHTHGIPQAIENTTGRHFNQTTIDTEPMPFNRHDLHCGECTAAVAAVTTFTRRNGSTVTAHFRLGPHQMHDDGCAYDADARTRQIIEESRGILSRERDQYILQIPHTTNYAPTLESVKPSQRPRTGQLHITENQDRELRPLLATARRIAKPLRDMQDPELSARFQARYADQVMGWEDFYLDLTDPAEYRKRSLELRGIARSEKKRPVAVAGTITKHATASGRQHYLELKLERPIKSPHMGWIHVRIISSTLAFADYQEGQQVLAYGLWGLYEARESNHNEWLSLWTDQPSALTHLNH